MALLKTAVTPMLTHSSYCRLALSRQYVWYHLNGIVLDCGISSVLAEELLLSCSKPSIYDIIQFFTYAMNDSDGF